ncbi:hypothetical protein GGR52DRAFT_552824 [Hypoxylon sp. FL1284]|nr:hypothetical protein GGR52DRAFT_552824 [Hypoxylon sp. FL1284]
MKRRLKKENALDYRGRWPTQQTIHESRIFRDRDQRDKPTSRRVKALEAASIPLLWISTKIESWQDNIDHQMEMIEARKQKRLSASTLSETSRARARRSAAANTRPGESTHPYDTGVGETSERSSDETSEERATKESAKRARLKMPSCQREQAPIPQKLTPRAPDNGPIYSQNSSTPSISTQDGNELTRVRRRSAEIVSPSRRRIELRNMLRRTKHQEKATSTSPSTVTSTSPDQPPTAAFGSRWWLIRKPKSTSDRLAQKGPAKEGKYPSTPVELQQAEPNVRNRSKSGHPTDEATKSTRKSRSKKGWKKHGRAVGQKPRTLKRSEKTAHGTPKKPREASQETSRSTPKYPKRHHRRLLSSHAQPSTERISYTPVNAMVPRDLVRDDLRIETPPMTPTQALRIWMGSRIWHSPKVGTQTDLLSPGAVTSTSTLIRRPSRESRVSTEQRNRAWIPFWPSPKPQSELPQDRDVDEGPGERADHLSPLAMEMETERSEPATQKRTLDRVSRKGWRSG